MRLASITALLLLALCCAVNAQLKVVDAMPTNGETNVSPSVEQVVIVFSEPVKMNSWSFVENGKGKFPEMVGDPEFDSPVSCVIKVKLKPNTTYSIGINSATKKGFKSAQSEKITCEPYVLTFKTGAARDEEEETGCEEPVQADESEGLGECSGGVCQLPSAAAKPKPKPAAASCSKPSVKNVAKPAKPQAKAASSSGSSKVPKTIIFRKYKDKSESAFSVLVPKGWVTEGGVLRVDPNAAGGAAQSIEAKMDFAVKKDAAGTVMIRWLPHVYFADMRGTMVEAQFPPGSNYAGMTVLPVLSAKDFIQSVMFPYVHPGATDVKFVELKNLPKLAQGLKNFWDNTICRYLPVRLDFQYDAAVAVATYEENGVSYKEILLTAIENRGSASAGMWSNRLTGYARAPQSEAKQWEPVVKVIADSMQANPQWIAGEIDGQRKRGEIVAETQRQIQEIERAMVENRRKTNAEINNDMYLTLTGQEDYVNPFTKEVERDSGDWKHRWVDANGNKVMSNQGDYDPNHDTNLNMTGFKLSKPRAR